MQAAARSFGGSSAAASPEQARLREFYRGTTRPAKGDSGAVGG
jgi:hypothetical protein